MCFFISLRYCIGWLCCVLGYCFWCFWVVGGNVGDYVWLFFGIFCWGDFCGVGYYCYDIVILLGLMN